MNAGRWAIAFAALLLLIAIGYWVAIGGFMPPAAPKWITAKPFAHRGNHFDMQHPENSLAAFKLAVQRGEGIELDVHLTADGRVVVMHDDDLSRMTGDSRLIAETDFADIRALRLAGTAEQIPTLAEVLSVVHGRVPILVEIKSRGAAGPLEDQVASQVVDYPGEIAVTSFSPLSLARMAALAPNVPRGQITGLFINAGLPDWQLFVLQHLLLNVISRPAFIVNDIGAVPSWDNSLQRVLGRKVLVYAPEDAAGAQFARQRADNFIGNPGSMTTP